MSDDLTLQIGTALYTGWRSVEVRRSISKMASTFKLDLTDAWGTEPYIFIEDTSVKILVGGEELITGYIDSIDPNIDSKNYDLSISGRCRTGDLIDCSAVNKPGTWKKLNILQICQRLTEPFGINVSMVEAPGDAIAEVTITAGQSPFDVLEPLCKEKALLPLGNVQGNLFLTVAGNEDANDSLTYGGDNANVITVGGKFDYKQRFSNYYVKGQRKSEGDGWNRSTVNIYGEATDQNIGRYRPKLFTTNSLLTNNAAAKRAAWEAQVRAGKSNTLNVMVGDWRQSNGDLWRENLNVYVYIPVLRVSAEMIIEEITYVLNDSGRTCSMKLVSPDTFAPEPKKVRKKKTASNKYGWRS